MNLSTSTLRCYVSILIIFGATIYKSNFKIPYTCNADVLIFIYLAKMRAMVHGKATKSEGRARNNLKKRRSQAFRLHRLPPVSKAMTYSTLVRVGYILHAHGFIASPLSLEYVLHVVYVCVYVRMYIF